MSAKVTSLGPAVLGNESILISAGDHSNSLRIWLGCFIPFFPISDKIVGVTDSEVKSDLPSVEMESR